MHTLSIMKFNLVFDNTNDFIPFEVTHNHKLFEWFVDNAAVTKNNSFSDAGIVYTHCSQLLTQLHWALSKTNEILWPLYDKSFPQHDNLIDYLDQHFLNQQHDLWVKSQFHTVDINLLRHSEDYKKNKVGNALHELYPDEIRKIKLAEAMIKLGSIYAYEEVNMAVHRLENFLVNNIEFKADCKWQVFDNPFVDQIESTNDVVNFSFGYTYVGRQYYNKWKFFDTDLKCTDHYNYEALEWAFQVNLARPETIQYSSQFVDWCQQHNVPSITTQLPIANVIDLDKNLHYYRTLLYKNSKQNNRASLKLI
jgi:hypothetical protein